MSVSNVFDGRRAESSLLSAYSSSVQCLFLEDDVVVANTVLDFCDLTMS